MSLRSLFNCNVNLVLMGNVFYKRVSFNEIVIATFWEFDNVKESENGTYKRV